MPVHDRYKVEICATLLVDKPPKLPLREEVMSLGFEIIYNADHIGHDISVRQADRAVERFRRQEARREAKKIRLFPRSPKRIQLKEELRRQKEEELRAPLAVSYESYEQELLYSQSHSHDSSSSSSDDDDDESDDDNDDIAAAQLSKTRTEESYVSAKSSRFRAIVRARRMKSLGGWFGKSKSIDETKDIAATKESQRRQQQPQPSSDNDDDVFAKAGFRDILVSVRSHETEATERSPTAHDTVTAHSGILSGESTLPSQTKPSVRLGDAIQNMEIQFVSSQSADKHLPELTTVPESTGSLGTKKVDSLDEDVKKAFADLGPVKDAFADLKVASDLYVAPVDVAKKSDFDPDEEAVAVAAAEESKPVASPWLSSALNYYKDKSFASSPTAKGHDPSTDEKEEPANVTNAAAVAVAEVADLVQLAKSYESANTLFDALQLTTTTLNQIESILTRDPELLKVAQHETGRLPLHTLCQRAMPNRLDEPMESLTDNLVTDIADFKTLVELIVGFYPDACKSLDKKGDLPVHLVARTLMEWEAEWYEAVYGKAAKENEPAGKTTVAISKLYQSMSECIEIVLQPVCGDPELCQQTGSVGEILPLHIASIFTSTVRTLRMSLEAYPQAAGLPCKLGGLTTFVPDDYLALQLHEELSTDFPKWELETLAGSDPNVKWSRSTACGQEETEDCIKRSDILFAYYPHLEPQRFEKARLRNIEALVNYEASRLVANNVSGMSKASQRLWRWMCLFTEQETGRATYVNSVQRVLDGLPLVSVKYLASMKTTDGEQVVNEAATDCSTLIRRCLRELEATTEPMSNIYNYRSWGEKQWGRLSQSLKGEIAILCRSIFNIESVAFPTTFVVLPYELSQNSDGSLGMADPAAVKVAVKFAECLLQLTQPASLIYFLDSKSMKHYDQSLIDSADQNDDLRKTHERIQESQTKMVQLYECQEQAYLYLIDEATGTPVIPSDDLSSTSLFPIILRDPAAMVEKIFPFMLVGMTLMRGAKALSVLMDVIMDENIKTVPPSWLDAAAELIASLDEDKFDKETAKEAVDLKDDLSSFASNASRKLKRSVKPSKEDSEWNVERSFIKMLLEIHDNQFTFSGLSAQSSQRSAVLWTRGPDSPDSNNGRQLKRSHSMPDSVTSRISRDDDVSQTGGVASIYSTRSFDADERGSAFFPDTLPIGGALNSEDAGDNELMKAGIAGWFERTKQNLSLEVKPVHRNASMGSGSQTSEKPRKTATRSRSKESHRESKAIPHKEESYPLKATSIRHKKASKPRGVVRPGHSKSGSKSPRRSKSPKKEKKKHDQGQNASLLQDRNRSNVSWHSKTPDLSEVSKKFEELTKKHDIMSHVKSNGTSSEPIEESHEDRQPVDEREDMCDEPYIIDLTSMRTPSTADRTEFSTSAEELILLRSDVHTGSEITCWDESKAEDLLSRTRTLLNRANRRTDETFWGRRQEREFRHKHALLFDEFAFGTCSSDDGLDKGKRVESPRRSNFESTRIWHDLSNQLETNAYIEDHQILMLKVRLAEEAKRMSGMGKQVEGVLRQEMIATDLQAEIFGKSSASDDGDIYDGAVSLSRSRRLLIRLCDLEDRLLCNDIDIQHLTLDILSMDLQVDEIHTDMYGVPPPEKASFVPPNEIRIRPEAESRVGFHGSQSHASLKAKHAAARPKRRAPPTKTSRK